MKIYLLISILSVSVISGSIAQVQPLPQAHAHNDYLHQRPLLDALSYGFTSVEADVHLIGNQLLVYHDKPAHPDPERTLEKLYLDPLQERMKSNTGRIYQGYNQPFYLMVDFKSDGQQTLNRLLEVLETYRDLLTSKGNAATPVVLFISGNRPVKEILALENPLVSLDGRPDELDQEIPATRMPVVSDNYRNVLSWLGENLPEPAEVAHLDELVRQVHLQGKKIRLWAAPDRPEVWQFLLDHQVDLINTDRIEDLSKFLQKTRSE